MASGHDKLSALRQPFRVPLSFQESPKLPRPTSELPDYPVNAKQGGASHTSTLAKRYAHPSVSSLPCQIEAFFSQKSSLIT